MGEFGKKCKKQISKALDSSFLENVSNLILALVALMLVISLLINPTILVGLALFCLFLWVILYC